MAMTSKERVMTVLKGGIPDRLPFNFWMDRDLMEKLDQRFGFNFRVSHYGADVIETFPDVDWMFGLSGETVQDNITVWQISPALKSAEQLCELVLPDPTNPDLCKYIRWDRENHPDKALFALLIHPLEVFLGLRIMENAFYDLYDYADEVEKFVWRVSDFQKEYLKQLKSAGADVLYIAGDISSTKGPLLSKDMLKRFCFEPLKQVIAAAKAQDMPVLFHTDGKMDELLPLFVEYGIDGINPLQPHLNDIKSFKENWGDKLKLYGGLDNCFTIPNGTAADVRKHVRESFEILGRGGGWIASSHDIPSYVPLENIDALVDEIKSCVY